MLLKEEQSHFSSNGNWRQKGIAWGVNTAIFTSFFAGKAPELESTNEEPPPTPQGDECLLDFSQGGRVQSMPAMVLATSSRVMRNHSFRVADRGQSSRPSRTEPSRPRPSRIEAISSSQPHLPQAAPAHERAIRVQPLQRRVDQEVIPLSSRCPC